MYIGLRVEYSLILWDFNDIWIFSIDVRKILKYHISGKFFQWESSGSMRTDGRTDRYDEANSRFSQFSNVPKNNKMHFLKLMF